MTNIPVDARSAASDALVAWDTLNSDTRVKLREEYGYYLDTLPPTCSLETKVDRFRRWLEERGVAYTG
jgi:hypothetical protein